MFFKNLFKKKEEDLSDQAAVFHNRETPRFTSKAFISIEGFEGEGRVRNISETGCCLESVTYVAIKPDDVYRIKITPIAGENTVSFSLELTASWTRSNETFFEAGFTQKDGSVNLQLKKYTETLKARGVSPDYGNKK